MHETTLKPGDRSHIAAVTTREELMFLLTRASELEHGLACIYLFAAYSLKNDVAEGGLTDEQASLVRGWKRRLASVGVEEMLHLAQVTNMLTAIGGAPHFRRSHFPMPATAFPFGVRLTLEPFSQETIERFVCYEMPEAGILSPEQEAIYKPIRAKIVAAQGGDSNEIGEGGAPLELDAAESGFSREPFKIDFTTVGEFYHKIETGFNAIPEADLFIGPPEAQANARFVDLDGQLVSVVDRASACAAIDMIVEQGEAPSTAHPDAHFFVFDEIRTQFEEAAAAAIASGIPFEPVRPVVSNPMTRFYDDTSGGTLIGADATHAVADIFNVAYETMLLMLLRFFAHTEENEAELEHLSRATLRIMTTVIRPLGDALTKMPVDDGDVAARTAGPGFGYNRDMHLLPHKRAAWIFFGERLRELAIAATRLRTAAPTLPAELEEAAAALEDLAQQFTGRHGPSNGAPHAPAIVPETNGPYLARNLASLVNARGEPRDTRPEMALCRCGGSANKPFCDGTHARIGFTSQKALDRVEDRRDDYTVGSLTIHDNRGICQHSAYCTDELASVFKQGQEPWIDPSGATVERVIAQVRKCPSGALSYSIDSVEYREQERRPKVEVSKDGPYRVSGGVKLKEDSWAAGASREHYTLCRCGGSKNKPFCDGTHWTNDFTTKVKRTRCAGRRTLLRASSSYATEPSAGTFEEPLRSS